MAKGKKTGGRDFKPGHPGKPKGAKDKAPRGLLRALVMEAMEQGEPAVRALQVALGWCVGHLARYGPRSDLREQNRRRAMSYAMRFRREA